jgi:hypothetical protein
MEGQREGDIEVLGIDPQSRTVKLNVYPNGGRFALQLTNHVDDTSAKFPGIVFERASLEQVLRLYAEFSDRTLLRWPRLPKLSFTMECSATNRAGAALMFRDALFERGVSSIPDGDKFLLIVPQAQASTVSPHSSQIKPSGSEQSEVLPAGTINFPDTDLNQVMQIYAELVGRKLVRNGPTPAFVIRTICLRTQTPLSRAEATYGLDTVLGWAGLKMVPEGDNLIKPVFTTETIEDLGAQKK